MTDNPQPKQPEQPTGRTTHDLAQEAREARRMLEEKMRQEQASPRPATGHLSDGRFTVRFEVRDFPTPVVVPVETEITIGRADTVANYTPEVDLTPYGAYRLGISRRHVILRRIDGVLHVIDLGSRNGTSLNNTKLEPNVPTPIHDGDEISLGNLAIRLSFHA